MERFKWAAVLGFALVAAMLVPAAQADTLSFSLTQNTCSGGCSPNPFGDVVVTAINSTTVQVTETLLNGAEFVNTGSGYALAFSITGDPTISIASLSSGFTIGNELTGVTESRDGAGVYDYWIVCTSCSSGASNPQPGPLTFTITDTAGITPESFEVLNNKGYYLASDIIAGNGSTGNAEAIDATLVAEPGTISLLAIGVLGLLAFRRKQVLA